MSKSGVEASIVISVCICTFRRAQDLQNTLISVAAQDLPDAIKMEIVVVDNDNFASAQSVVAAFKTANPQLLVVYANEAAPGVSFARNRCLAEASGSWVAFLDDDEIAPPHWLAALWATAQTYAAGAVFGQVRPVYQAEVPIWLTNGAGFERPRFSTGTLLGWGDARTGNVLMTRDLVAAVGQFDTRFAKTGGEDSYFFSLALKHGFSLVWCDEAAVYESVPPSRMTQKWLIQRAFLGGRTFARLHATIDGSGAYFKWCLHGLLMCLILALPSLFLYVFQRPGWLQQVRKLAGALGKIVAPFYGAGEYGKR
ncbi:glycosyltransferase family 2 protein [Undibacterium sp.]|uniref:glycosyltransferase family 2 protein n=1 Tax=Undibacterium sp. TaxID=1914977 RepID=UPI0025E86910|nr:glycosyltransferase family 2 protein [Undibacterium sp.]